MTTSKRATESALEQLHKSVTKNLADRLKSGDQTTADIRAAIEWLKVNGITGPAPAKSALAELEGLIPELDLDFDEVESGVL